MTLPIAVHENGHWSVHIGSGQSITGQEGNPEAAWRAAAEQLLIHHRVKREAAEARLSSAEADLERIEELETAIKEHRTAHRMREQSRERTNLPASPRDCSDEDLHAALEPPPPTRQEER